MELRRQRLVPHSFDDELELDEEEDLEDLEDDDLEHFLRRGQCLLLDLRCERFLFLHLDSLLLEELPERLKGSQEKLSEQYSNELGHELEEYEEQVLELELLLQREEEDDEREHLLRERLFLR